MKILFVCTGNTCRSPMAEAIARQIIAERGLRDVEVSSAGISAWEGSTASDGALLVGMERGFDLSAHRARTLTRQLIEENDLILVMGPHHLERAEVLGGAGKSHVLTEYTTGHHADHGINDPFGGDLDGYRETADELEREVRKALDRAMAERIPPTK